MRLRPSLFLPLFFVVAIINPAFAIRPPSQQPPGDLHQKAFFKPALTLTTSLAAIQPSAAPRPGQPGALSQMAAQYGQEMRIYVDSRNGVVSDVIARIPMIPGSGNNLSMAAIGQTLAGPYQGVDAPVVGQLLVQWITANGLALGVDPAQLGTPIVEQVSDTLWHIRIQQTVGGVPVRWARFTGTISHGNLVLAGAENWENVTIGTKPSIQAAEAMQAGFEYAGGQMPEDRTWNAAHLEILPMVSPSGGYEHRLAWVFGFERGADPARWEVVVDAQSGEILSFQDTTDYVTGEITGSAFPQSSTDSCVNAEYCGDLQQGVPMPWADTGFPAPNNYTNSGGVFDYISGTLHTTLNGRYIHISDQCGSISESSSSATLNLGGSSGDHDCVSGGSSAGNTPAARTAYYELNRMTEIARGYLPNNTWLQQQLTANVNISMHCNAFWNGTTVNFFQSGNGCRNTGELGPVMDHEWGHGLDSNDTNGVMSNSSEAYADIAAIYRQQSSCVGYGFFQTRDSGCGMTADGTGFNADESQTSKHLCDLNCSGVRDTDYAKHQGGKPDTPENFVCTKCMGGSGPCGAEVHCAAAPSREAAWDFAARDLQTAPFSYDATTAFLIANRIFYQGSGNIQSWHNCTCPSSSDGCGAANGYMQWLAADDDNGSLLDGTPHMTALYAAFNRHGIACADPAPKDSGCSTAPGSAPVLQVTGGEYSASLSWNSVPNATSYGVFRSDGVDPCTSGKALIATVTGNSYTDNQPLGGRRYAYTVVANGSSSACSSPASACTEVIPRPCDNSSAIIISPASLPPAIDGLNYSQQISASGTVAPYTFQLASGQLPPGLSLSSEGLLAGKTTASGNFTFALKVSDGGGCSRTWSYTLTTRTCLFCDDFNDGLLASNWSYLLPSWSEAGSDLIGTPQPRKALAIAQPAFSGCSTCTVETVVKLDATGGAILTIIGWYQDPSNNVQLSLKGSSGKWTLKQRLAGSGKKTKAVAQLQANTYYDVKIVNDGTNLTVYVGGTQLMQAPVVGALSGTVGFMIQGTTARFDSLAVY